jgi:hypothetical protein
VIGDGSAARSASGAIFKTAWSFPLCVFIQIQNFDLRTSCFRRIIASCRGVASSSTARTKGAAMRKQFEDLLDEITEARCNAATSNDTRLEPRVARLEHIVQQMLLALIETTQHREKQ